MIHRGKATLGTSLLLVLLVLSAWTGPLIAATSSPSDQEGSSSDANRSSRLEIKLTVEGEISTTQYPKFFVEFTNQGNKPITMTKPCDGSKWHWRTPLVGWSALRVDSDAKHPAATPRFSGPRCGNVNPLTKADVITLQPNQSIKFEEWGTRGMFSTPGKYRLVYYYQNVPTHPMKGQPLGKHDAQVLKRIRQSTPVRGTSNEVIVSVKP